MPGDAVGHLGGQGGSDIHAEEVTFMLTPGRRT